MAKNSKVASNRVAVTDAVSASLRVHGPEVAAGLSAAFELGGSGGRATRSEIEKLLGLLGQLLDGAAVELAAADAAHVSELSDDDAPREQRDAATAKVRDKLLGLRDLFNGAYGEAVAKGYHVVEALPEQPQQVLQRGRNVEELLRTKPLKASSRHASLKLKVSELADELAALLAPLEAALSNVRQEEREAQATQERKNRAGESWQRIYQGVTYMAYGAYILAGRRDLAERIEPTVRRRSGSEEPGEPPAGEPLPPPAPATP